MVSCLIPVTLSSRWQTIFCGLLYRSCLKVCLQLWGSGCVSTRGSSNIVWGMYRTVGENDDPIVSMRCMGLDHWIRCAPVRVMHLKKQRSQAIYGVIFQNYCLTIIGILGSSLRICFKSLYFFTWNTVVFWDRESLAINTIICVIHELCIMFLNTV